MTSSQKDEAVLLSIMLLAVMALGFAMGWDFAIPDEEAQRQWLVIHEVQEVEGKKDFYGRRGPSTYETLLEELKPQAGYRYRVDGDWGAPGDTLVGFVEGDKVRFHP